MVAGPDLTSAIAIQQATEQTAHFLASGTALFAYDWALTLSDEIRFIWQSHFTTVKMLFLINRYLTLIVLVILILGAGGVSVNSVSATTTGVITASAGVLMGVLFIVWNWMLAIRVHALWGLKRQIKYFIAACWTVSSACALALNIHAIIWMAPHQVAILDLRACVPGALPGHYFIMWIPGICYETLLFGMAMAKLLAMYRESSADLGKLLLRDGVLHYTVLTSARVANLALFAVGDPHTIFVVLFLTIGLGSTMISRMVLNLREWHYCVQAQEDKRGMHRMVDLATRCTGGGQAGEPLGDSRTPLARIGRETYNRDVSVRVDRPRPASDRSDNAGSVNSASDRTSGRGVKIRTVTLTLVDSFDVVDLEKQAGSSVLFDHAVHRNHL